MLEAKLGEDPYVEIFLDGTYSQLEFFCLEMQRKIDIYFTKERLKNKNVNVKYHPFS